MELRRSVALVQILVQILVLTRSNLAQKPALEERFADIFFLVDSGLSAEDFVKVRTLLTNVVKQLNVSADTYRMGLAQYSELVKVEFLLNTHKTKNQMLPDIKRFKARKLQRDEKRNLGLAMQYAATNFFTEEKGSRAQQGVRQYLVVLSGKASDDSLDSALRLINSMGITVVGISLGAPLSEIKYISSPSYAYEFVPKMAPTLKEVFEKQEVDSAITGDGIPVATDGLPATTDGLPVATDGLPATTDGLPVATDGLPVDTDGLPVVLLEERFADIFFLVDSGLSVDDFSKVRTLLTDVVNQLNVSTDAYRMGLAQYSQSVKVEFLLNTHQTKSPMLPDIDRFKARKLQRDEKRNLGSALEYAATNFFTEEKGSRAEQGVRQYLVVLSGKASDDSLDRALRLIRDTGVTVVGISMGAPLSEIKYISSPSYAYEFVPNMEEMLKEVFEKQEADSAVTGDCRSARLADIVFIVDESSSIKHEKFRMVRTFVHSVVSGLEVGPDWIRVGVVTYNDQPKAHVYLDSFNNKTDLLKYIKSLEYRQGNTYTGKALNFTRQNLFQVARGSRGSKGGKGIQQVAVIITDGKSQDNVTEAAVALRRHGVTVYSLGVKDANREELEKMASHPANKHVFIVDSFNKLKAVEQKLQKTLCQNIYRDAITVSTRRTGIKKDCVQTDEADIFFLIDHSGSIWPSDFKDMRNFILEFLQTFRIGPDHVRMGVAKYSDNPKLEFNLTTYSNTTDLKSAVINIKQEGGGTNTGKALSFMGPLFKNASASRGHKVREYLVVITDGKSQDKVKASAEALRAQGVTIYAIGVKNASVDELKEISGDPKKMFFVNNFDALKLIKDDVIADICSTDVCKDVSGDLLFLVDSSGSIYPKEYQKMKDFMKAVMGKSSIGPDSVHFGVLQYSEGQKLEFPLNQYISKDQMLAAVDRMEQIGGGTNTGQAIAYAQQYFSATQGGRPALTQRLVVITDGEAQDEVKGPAQRLRDSGVVVYAIGVVNANTTQLLEISGARERVYSERDFDALKDLENELAVEICKPETECGTERADMLFLVDGSSSITLEKFHSMQRFMSSMVNQTTVGYNLTRVGVILYSDDPKSVFSLNRYSTKRDVLGAINGLTQPDGNTYTGKALEYSLQYFGPQHGGRAAQRVPQMLMVITDGAATDRYSLEAPSQALARAGVNVFSIGVEGANRTQLEIMAGQKKSRVFYVDNFKSLETLYKNISKVICKDIKPECEKQQADLVFLLDQSGSINASDYRIMKNFTSELVRSFNISQDKVRVGLAQFSNTFEHQIYLSDLYSEEKVVKHLENMRQRGGGTMIGLALNSMLDYFTAARGSRLAQKVSQNLVVITDGDSQDKTVVKDASDRIHRLGVEVFVIGIGSLNQMILKQISQGSERLFIIENFESLETIKTKVLKTICESQWTPSDQSDCSIDIALGFDVSHRSGFVPNTPLFSGQSKLQSYLRDITHYLSSVPKLCCTEGRVTPNLAFRVLDESGQLVFDANFEPYNEGVVTKLLALRPATPSYFDSALLQSFQDLFSTESEAGVKVLVVFSDGLNEVVENLQKQSEQLLKSGVNALMVVALEGAQDSAQMQMLEFGRGFGYGLPLNIGMQGVASSILKQIDTASERECCKVLCKCSGDEGEKGSRGPPGNKGFRGYKGYPGFPGEEGVGGDRGPPGPSGPQGVQGCPGLRGQKGDRGHTGDLGENGEDGLNGINGEQGVSGKEGPKGAPGRPGEPGIPGLRGEAGLKGQRGLRGDPGEPGVQNTTPGPKGDPGNPGLLGAPGPDGEPGESGIMGNPGADGRRGPPGAKGTPGAKGDTGPRGTPGASGPQGPTGEIGLKGTPGPQGLPGAQGGPGAAGAPGLSGRRGANGQKGQPGEPGEQGIPGPEGPRGPPGLDGINGYGPQGPPGAKGAPGFPGHPGLVGEDGQQGPKGFPGPKGNHGRGGNSGNPGDPGSPGETGFTGHKGPPGPPGQRKTECELVTYIRQNCACSMDKVECPMVPTELVVALDMSEDVTPVAFDRQRSAVLSLLSSLSISESDCPRGARVSVVAFDARTKYLVRFSDYRRKAQLLDAVENIRLVTTSGRRQLGAAMRFVGHNVFKRVRSGAMVRKVALFLSNGESQDQTELVTAVMQLRALGIVSAVVSLSKAPGVEKALQVDDSGNSMFTVLSRNQDKDLERIRSCALCYDPCSPAQTCSFIQDRPLAVNLDLALVLDGSREVPQDQFQGSQELLGSVVSQVRLSPSPQRPGPGQVRVSLVQMSGPRPTLEFGLNQYQNQEEVQRHLVKGVVQKRGSAPLGQTLEYALKEVLLKAPPRRQRALLFVLGTGSESQRDVARLNSVSQQALCEGVAVAVVTVGSRFNRTQVEKMASPPLDQHLIHLNQIGPDQKDYAQRFLRVLLSALHKRVNSYPPASVQRKCGQGSNGQGPLLVDEEEEEEEEEEEDFQEQTGLGQNDVCVLDQDPGSCGDYKMMWFFDSVQRECSRFWFGGCGGNGNRFGTQQECEATCLRAR